jgi:hypothetical protein
MQKLQQKSPKYTHNAIFVTKTPVATIFCVDCRVCCHVADGRDSHALTDCHVPDSCHVADHDANKVFRRANCDVALDRNAYTSRDPRHYRHHHLPIGLCLLAIAVNQAIREARDPTLDRQAVQNWAIAAVPP